MDRSPRHYWSDLPSKISDGVKDGLGEFFRSFALQSPVEYLAYITASASKVNVVLIVGHRVLKGNGLEVHPHAVVGNVP